LLRIGVVAALVGGGLAITAAPALADNPAVQITALSPTTLGPGQSTTLQYQITNRPGNDEDVDITVSANGLTCNGDCGTDDLTIQFANGPRQFTATLRAPTNLAPGSNQRVTVTVRAVAGGQDDSKSAQVTLRGPDAPQTIRSISGKVVNITNGKGIADAVVALNDGDHRYNTQADNDGDFKFTSSDSSPISPGRILIAAAKEGFNNNQISTDVAPGQAKSGLKLTLKSTASASPSPTSSASSPADEEATEEATDAPSTEGSIDPAAAGNNSDSGGGGGLFSWVLIILGGLLVALGVGAIVLLMIRRKDGGEDDTGDALPGPNGPRPTPGAQGVYRGGPEPTMVTGGAPMGGSPTMAMRPGLAEAPTMMHQPVDEYGDPYGTPLRAPQPTSGAQPGGPQPGYGYQGANQGGYGPAGSPTAPMAPGSPGAPTAYGSASPSAYGGGATGRASASVSPAGSYGPRDYAPPASQGGYGYDEPTGRYDRNGGYGQPDPREPRPPAGPAPGGYDPDRGGYGQPANGYDAGYGPGNSNGYGRDAGYAPSGDNGYAPGGGNGYDPAPPGGGYDGRRYQPSPPAPPDGYGPQGGYDGYGQQGGYPPPYEQDGYDQPASYERTPEPRGGGYDQQRGYDQGYYDEPTKRGERPSRRSLDWLDD
jgi:Carboxypeptidase regulatory-like domain